VPEPIVDSLASLFPALPDHAASQVIVDHGEDIGSKMVYYVVLECSVLKYAGPMCIYFNFTSPAVYTNALPDGMIARL